MTKSKELVKDGELIDIAVGLFVTEDTHWWRSSVRRMPKGGCMWVIVEDKAELMPLRDEIYQLKMELWESCRPVK